MTVFAAASEGFGRDLDDAFARIERLLGQARERGAELLALPEAALGGYLSSLHGEPDDQPPQLDPDGPEIRRLIALAGETVVVAGYCERAPRDGGRPYNSAVCVTGDGVLGRHRKVHQPLDENASYAAGDGFTAFDTPVGRLGMMICYDKAFPESARSIALDGARIGVCISAWPASRTNAAPVLADDRWTRRFDLFDRARALENQIVWVSANQSGRWGDLRFMGHAQIVDPDGVVRASTAERTGLAVARLDVAAERAAVRARIDHLGDRRAAAYAPAPAPAHLLAAAITG